QNAGQPGYGVRDRAIVQSSDGRGKYCAARPLSREPGAGRSPVRGAELARGHGAYALGGEDAQQYWAKLTEACRPGARPGAETGIAASGRSADGAGPAAHELVAPVSGRALPGPSVSRGQA